MKGCITVNGLVYEYYELNYIKINNGKLIINYTDLYGEVHEEIEDMPEFLHVFRDGEGEKEYAD